MPMMVKESGGSYKPAPAGNHAAICIQIIDMGLQQSTYQGATRERRQIRLVWEIDENMEDGRPYTISQNYTLSLNEKARLRKDLESWRGKAFSKEELEGFDLEKLLGKPCLLNVIHNENGDRVYANVSSISPMPKGMKAPDVVNDLICYSCDDPDDSLLEKLHEKLGDAVLTGKARYLESQGKHPGASPEPDPRVNDNGFVDDEIPF